MKIPLDDSGGTEAQFAGTVAEVISQEKVELTDGTLVNKCEVKQWWICTVLCAVRVIGGEHSGKSGHLEPPAYSIDDDTVELTKVRLDTDNNALAEISCSDLEQERRDGELKVKFDGLGRAEKPRWVPIEQVNQTGKRNTTQQPGQAPFG